MISEINPNEMNNYIHKDESGEIDFEKSIQIVRELSAAVRFNPDQNILIDLRDTTLSNDLKVRLMEVIMVCVNTRSHSFERKIASVVPDDQERISKSKIFKAGMRIHDFRYSYFTDYDDAVEWLSENP